MHRDQISNRLEFFLFQRCRCEHMRTPAILWSWRIPFRRRPGDVLQVFGKVAAVEPIRNVLALVYGSRPKPGQLNDGYACRDTMKVLRDSFCIFRPRIIVVGKNVNGPAGKRLVELRRPFAVTAAARGSCNKAERG